MRSTSATGDLFPTYLARQGPNPIEKIWLPQGPHRRRARKVTSPIVKEMSSCLSSPEGGSEGSDRGLSVCSTRADGTLSRAWRRYRSICPSCGRRGSFSPSYHLFLWILLDLYPHKAFEILKESKVSWSEDEPDRRRTREEVEDLPPASEEGQKRDLLC